jgi:hypothetical protein
MAQDLIRRHLLQEIELVERHLTEGDVHIADQRKRIGWQERTGRNSAHSRELLATFLSVRASHLSHQDRLIRDLGDNTTARRPDLSQ